MTTGEKLKYLRLKTKKTLKEQSEILGVSLNSVYRWEHDLTAPKKSTLKKIVEMYDVSLEWLLHESDDEDIIARMSNGASNSLNNGARLDEGLEQQLLKMFRKLSDSKKHKMLGYLERMYIESMDGTA